MKKVKKDRRRERGQSMTEYAILVAVIAILSVAIVTQFGNQIRELFFKSGDALATGKDTIDIDEKMNSADVDKKLGAAAP